MIETRLLQYFLAVARELNVTKAAETLFISQSTLSKQMMDLERRLGRRLFVRGGRKLTLTEEGVFLRDRAREIVALTENTEAALRAEAETLGGDVSVACGETAAMDVVARTMKEFREAYPGVRLHIYSGDDDAVLVRIDKGLADMGLLLGPVRQEKYDYLNLRRRDVYGLLMPAGCELAARESVGVEELAGLPLILAEQTFYGRQELDWFGVDFSSLNVVATYSLIYNATFLVERGVGCALCLEGLVNTGGRSLAFRPISPEISVDVCIVTKKYQNFSPAAKVFYERLKERALERVPRS